MEDSGGGNRVTHAPVPMAVVRRKTKGITKKTTKMLSKKTLEKRVTLVYWAVWISLPFFSVITCYLFVSFLIQPLN